MLQNAVTAFVKELVSKYSGFLEEDHLKYIERHTKQDAVFLLYMEGVKKNYAKATENEKQLIFENFRKELETLMEGEYGKKGHN